MSQLDEAIASAKFAHEIAKTHVGSGRKPVVSVFVATMRRMRKYEFDPVVAEMFTFMAQHGGEFVERADPPQE